MSYLPYAVAAWLFIIGLYGVITSRNLVHLCICVSVIQSSSYVLLLAIGYRTGRPAPVYADIPAGTPAVDPVVQALMLTDVVVEVTVMALLLALAVQVHKRLGTLDPDRLRKLRG
ncbi:MAG TPA: cation:proton antiporter subunit C [Bryobacteraceae bacterium]|jgi:multicomponent Na+:H+ antiporter subunit C|nr:cation:proton antiporter subunit C [Bryobacteraceae bacterium]